ncbi:MAG: FAD-dependent oxidoreductase [Alphaproteobacteria bacterium]|nr:FAD-dependent oxidoreductase [Alphaproteobacteria bacterium]
MSVQKSALEVDICIIGAGSGGLSVAAGASQLGASVALVERHLMGGDCLNFGCVPSKALLAAGKSAHNMETAGRFGLTAVDPNAGAGVDVKAVRQHVRDVIAGIAPHDSVERFRALGVNVIEGAAKFTGPREVEVEVEIEDAGQSVTARRITARRFVIATGSSPFVPPIPGLDKAPFLTNETLFEYDDPMAHLIVIGGGPIGVEMSQAHQRLGVQVTLIEKHRILAKDDPEMATVVHNRLAKEGVNILTGCNVERITPDSGDGITVHLDDGQAISGSHILVAAGRKANVSGLNLEAANVDYSPRGIVVDRRLRTSNKKIFAIGDVAGGLQFTHVAGHHAGIVIRNALFRLPAKAKQTAIPWVTYTDPELAQVGLQETDARAEAGDIHILRFPFAENDRAQAERDTDGLIKIITAKNGRVLGVTIVGPHGGDLIQPWVLAVEQGLKIGAMAGAIWPYPTFGEVGHRAAGSYFVPKLFTDRTRAIVKFLSKFG